MKNKHTDIHDFSDRVMPGVKKAVLKLAEESAAQDRSLLFIRCIHNIVNSQPYGQFSI